MKNSTGTRSTQDFPQIKYVNRTKTNHCGLLPGALEMELNCLSQLEFKLPAAAAALFGLESFHFAFCLSWAHAGATAFLPSLLNMCAQLCVHLPSFPRSTEAQNSWMDGNRQKGSTIWQSKALLQGGWRCLQGPYESRTSSKNINTLVLLDGVSSPYYVFSLLPNLVKTCHFIFRELNIFQRKYGDGFYNLCSFV